MKTPLLLVGACLLLFFTGLGDVPFYTRGEPREALVAREMLRSGDWLVPARPDGELTRKPPVYYWASATTLSLLPGRPELAARLPSALLGTAGILLAWGIIQATFGAAVALPAALMLATTLEWIRAATTARVDMALVVGMTLLFGAWLIALARGRERLGGGVFAMAVAGGVIATLAKGPVALVLPALAVAALVVVRRDLSLIRRLGAIQVLAVAGVLAGIWYGAAFAKHGWPFFDIVAQENWLRYVDTEDAGTGHKHGLAYLPLVGLIGLLPWTPLLPVACAPLVDRPRRTIAVEFAAAWVVVIFTFFWFSAAKRSVYLLPLFPPLCLLLALGVTEPSARWPGRVLSWSAALYPPLLVLLGIAAVLLTSGIDVVALLRPFLKARDAQNTVAVVAAARAARPALLLLGVFAFVATALAIRARRAADWRRLVLVVATFTVAATAILGVYLRPPMARAVSLQPFMVRIDPLLPRDATLHAFFRPDAGLRFYAPRPLEAWWPNSRGPAYLLLWEDERQLWRGADGKPLAPLAVSDARQPSRGPLNLVLVPDGAQLRRRVKTDSRSP